MTRVCTGVYACVCDMMCVWHDVCVMYMCVTHSLAHCACVWCPHQAAYWLMCGSEGILWGKEMHAPAGVGVHRRLVHVRQRPTRSVHSYERLGEL